MSFPARLLAQPRRIVLTGASRGIGAETARQLARGGHSLVLVARTASTLEAVAGEIAAAGHARPETRVLDVTRADDVRQVIDALARERPIDVLVNNAGSCRQSLFLDTPLADLEAELALDYWGAVHTTRAVLPHMIARRRGAIVNVSSLLGSVASPTTASYCASKAALEAWTHALRGEVAMYGIDLSIFVAPHTRTEMGAATRFDGVHSLPVPHTAAGLVRAIDRRPRRCSSSPVIALLLRLAAWLPSFMEGRLRHSVRALLPAPAA